MRVGRQAGPRDQLGYACISRLLRLRPLPHHHHRAGLPIPGPKRQLASTVRTGFEIVRFLLTLPGAREYERKGFLSAALKAGLIAVPLRAQPPVSVDVTESRAVPEVPPERGDSDRDLVEAQIDDLLGIGKE